jgi:hypothetical protein
MDRFTYQQLRESRPGLELPLWHRLTRTDRHRAKRLTIDELVSRRVAVLLARTNGTDRLQAISLKSRRNPAYAMKAQEPFNPFQYDP